MYPTYKDSSIEWLGEVPGHWSIRRLGSSVDCCINGIWGSEPDGHNDLACIRVADFDRTNMRVLLESRTFRSIAPNNRDNRLLNKGDLLLEKSGGGDLKPVGAVVLYEHDLAAVCSNFVGRLVVSVGFDPNYLTYLHSCLYAMRLNVRSIKQTTGIQNLDVGSYLAEHVAFPPLVEQITIAMFLDYETAKINTLIKKQERLVDLLQERRAALISHAVTKGLDSSIPMKDSGSEWIGEIPAHWEKKRLKLLVSNEVDKADSAQIYDSYIALEHVESWTGKVRPEKGKDVENEAKCFLENDILFGKLRPYLAKVSKASERGICSGEFLVLRPLSGEIIAAFLAHKLRSKEIIGLINSSTFGTKMPRAEWNFIGNVEIAFPSDPNEQSSIVNFLDRETEKIDGLIAKIRQVIKLQKELRSALISAAVTGKIDVQQASISTV